MAKTVFVAGSVVSGTFLNSINNPVFVDTPDNDGEIAKITDADLTSVAGNIKPEWQSFRDGLKVTEDTGLVCNVAGGSITTSDRSIVTIPPTSIAAIDGTTSYIWVNDAGTIAAGTTPPLLSILLAEITASGGAISAIADLRNRELHQVLPRIDRVRVFGGFGTIDKTATNGETFSDGLYYYKNFTVPNGVSITINQFAKIICSGSVDISGSVTVTPATQGGGGFNTGALDKSITSGDATGFGGVPGAGIGAGAGANAGLSGQAYNWLLQPYGSGGGSGFVSFSGSVAPVPNGGSGGGGLWIEAAGTITVNGTITANGGAGADGDPGSTNNAIDGGAGGSGGTVILISALSVTIGNGLGVINCRGGAGGNGFKGAGADAAAGGDAGGGAGGGGGGGGQIVLIAPFVNTTGATLSLTGGAVGANVSLGQRRFPRGGGNGGAGISGGTGAVGKITIINELPIS